MDDEDIPDNIKKLMDKFEKKELEKGFEAEKEHNTGDELDVVDSNIDLVKIALAHLEEDPKYYSKLEKIHQNESKLYTFDDGMVILIELPYIQVGEKVIDLEFENDKTQALKKIIKAIMREEIIDKHGNKFKLTTDNEVKEFMSKLMKNTQVRKLIS
ncbi:MAG: hypothetical protein KKB59_19645 [Spirochaetes bacterium]|nr:hypothetical protein [Spirochaetota bacterium]